MSGRIISTMITMFVFILFFLLSITYSLHKKIELNVDTINYNVVETVSTNGKFTDQLYSHLTNSITKHGDFEIIVKLERQITPGIYDIYYDTDYILDENLEIGDKISVYIEARDISLFGSLMNASTFGIMDTDNLVDSKVRSIKTAIVSKNGS